MELSNQPIDPKNIPDFLSSKLDFSGCFGLVGLAENDAALAWLSSKGTDARFIGELIPIGFRDAADGYLQLLLDLSLHFGAAIPMGQGESTVDLGLLLILRGEERIELFLGVDLLGVHLAEGQRPIQKSPLDLT